jgi:hypothetical protein
MKANKLILKNAKGTQIGFKFYDSSISFSVGSKIRLPLHIVRMGACYMFSDHKDCNASSSGSKMAVLMKDLPTPDTALLSD